MIILKDSKDKKIKSEETKNYCESCGKPIFLSSTHKNITYCPVCYYRIVRQNKQLEIEKKQKEKQKRIEEMRSPDYKPKPGEAKCPYCGLWLRARQKTPTSTGGNIVRGAVFLPWGVVSAVKNKPFVQCPHCKMKIPQG